jgi:predicted O-methyltransferase YrrM
VRSGRVADSDNSDPDVRGTRAVAEAVAQEPRVDATVVQTVGSKGYDGFLLALVR